MSRLRWIVVGLLGGALYSWLATIIFSYAHAIAWPKWFGEFAQDHFSLAIRLWDMAIWLSVFPGALLVGLILTKILHRAAIHAAIVGAFVTFLYGAFPFNFFEHGVFQLSLRNWVSVGSFMVAVQLPVSAFVLGLYNKPFKSDTGSAGVA